MLPLSALTRCALVAAATALVAVGPRAADARKKPPLAFLTGTVSMAAAPDATTFEYTYRVAVAHPASGKATDGSGGGVLHLGCFGHAGAGVDHQGPAGYWVHPPCGPRGDRPRRPHRRRAALADDPRAIRTSVSTVSLSHQT